MPKAAKPPREGNLSAVKTKSDVIEDRKAHGLSKGAMAAERASAGIGTDDRDPDNFYRPTKRS